MVTSEFDRAVQNNFSSWVLSLKQVAASSEAFTIGFVDQHDYRIQVILGGRPILLTLAPDGSLSWVNKDGISVRELAGTALQQGWSYEQGSEPITAKPYEQVTSPKIDRGTETFQILIGWHPHQFDTFVMMMSEAKPSL